MKRRTRRKPKLRHRIFARWARAMADADVDDFLLLGDRKDWPW